MDDRQSYLRSVHRDGRIWNLSVAAILILVPVMIGVIYHTLPDWNGFLLGLVATAPMYWTVGAIETVAALPTTVASFVAGASGSASLVATFVVNVAV